MKMQPEKYTKTTQQLYKKLKQYLKFPLRVLKDDDTEELWSVQEYKERQIPILIGYSTMESSKHAYYGPKDMIEQIKAVEGIS